MKLQTRKELKQKQRVAKQFSKLLAKRERQVKRRQRLERIRAAFSDFHAGLITKTELRKSVPRSWLVYV
jgi:hypothetical protein